MSISDQDQEIVNGLLDILRLLYARRASTSRVEGAVRPMMISVAVQTEDNSRSVGVQAEVIRRSVGGQTQANGNHVEVQCGVGLRDLVSRSVQCLGENVAEVGTRYLSDVNGDSEKWNDQAAVSDGSEVSGSVLTHEDSEVGDGTVSAQNNQESYRLVISPVSPHTSAGPAYIQLPIRDSIEVLKNFVSASGSVGAEKGQESPVKVVAEPQSKSPITLILDNKVLSKGKRKKGMKRQINLSEEEKIRKREASKMRMRRHREKKRSAKSEVDPLRLDDGKTPNVNNIGVCSECLKMIVYSDPSVRCPCGVFSHAGCVTTSPHFCKICHQKDDWSDTSVSYIKEFEYNKKVNEEENVEISKSTDTFAIKEEVVNEMEDQNDEESIDASTIKEEVVNEMEDQNDKESTDAFTIKEEVIIKMEG